MISIDRVALERFRSAISNRLGLQFEDDRLDLLIDALGKRMYAQGLEDAQAYLDRYLEPRFDPRELDALAALLTVGETYFFRDPNQFRALVERVLPIRIQVRSAQRTLQVLSLGCASGEEPYSLAMVIRSVLEGQDGWRVSIRGVDISAAGLQKAARGRYSAWSLRATPAHIRDRYFHAQGNELVLDPAVRALVKFEQRNLIDAHPDLWRADTYDVVFCRNMLMYLRPDAMQDIVQRIEQSLAPGGFLFLGHAETLRGISQRFHLCHTHDTFYYQRREDAPAVTRAAGVLRTDAGPGASYREPEPLPSGLSAGLFGLSPAPGSTPVPRDGGLDARDRDPGARQSESALEAAGPLSLEPAEPWMVSIRDASARIERLARGHAPRVVTAVDPAPAERVEGTGRPAWSLVAALELMREERFSEALAQLDALPAAAGRDADALLLRAILLANCGDPAGAEGVCARLLQIDELNAGARYVVALCREQAGDRDAAVDHLQAAIYLDHNFAMPHLRLGLLARRRGEAGLARRELGLAQALLPREDASRILLFGGGFSRESLQRLCAAELKGCEEAP